MKMRIVNTALLLLVLPLGLPSVKAQETTPFLPIEEVGCSSIFCWVIPEGAPTVGSSLGCATAPYSIRWRTDTDIGREHARTLIAAQRNDDLVSFYLNGCVDQNSTYWPTFSYFSLRSHPKYPDSASTVATKGTHVRYASCDGRGNCYLRISGGDVGPNACQSRDIYWHRDWPMGATWYDLVMEAHRTNSIINLDYFDQNDTCYVLPDGVTERPTLARAQVQVHTSDLTEDSSVFRQFHIQQVMLESTQEYRYVRLVLDGNVSHSTCGGVPEALLKRASNPMFDEIYAMAMTAQITGKQVEMTFASCDGTGPGATPRIARMILNQ